MRPASNRRPSRPVGTLRPIRRLADYAPLSGRTRCSNPICRAPTPHRAGLGPLPYVLCSTPYATLVDLGGFEPPTSCLQSRHSPTELQAHRRWSSTGRGKEPARVAAQFASRTQAGQVFRPGEEGYGSAAAPVFSFQGADLCYLFLTQKGRGTTPPGSFSQT